MDNFFVKLTRKLAASGTESEDLKRGLRLKVTLWASGLLSLDSEDQRQT